MAQGYVVKFKLPDGRWTPEHIPPSVWDGQAIDGQDVVHDTLEDALDAEADYRARGRATRLFEVGPAGRLRLVTA